MIVMTHSSETDDIFIADLLKEINPQAEGEIAYALIERLYPLCRSITGNGVRRSLRVLCETIPLALREIVSHTQVFDWTVPDEWNVRDAYIMNEAGERLVDFRKSNLHVLNYSIPINRMMSLAELRPHLFTIPEAPDSNRIGATLILIRNANLSLAGEGFTVRQAGCTTWLEWRTQSFGC